MPVAPRSLALVLYRAVTRLAEPAAGPILRYRLRRGKEDGGRLGERLGRASRNRAPGPLAWVHAASVGEALSVLPLVGALGERRPDVTVLLTTGTVTSAQSVAHRLPPHALHQFIPLDTPRSVGRFLDHWQPSLGVFTEQEIWPNLVFEANRRGVALVLVNGRMSAPSFERWQRRPALAEALLSRFRMVLAQDESYAARYRALGAARVTASGNLKIDAPPPPVDAALLAQLQTALAGRSRMVAASTHQGEELAVAETHRLLLERLPAHCTIIVPRHPDRGSAIAAELAARGHAVALRSQGAHPDAATGIYIADTMGELGTFYAASPIAFIGGSLVEHGGQNPIEAVRLGAAVLTGPHTWNFAESFGTLLDQGGARLVRSPPELAASVAELLSNPAALARQREAAAAALAGLSGALGRTLDALLPLLPAPVQAGEALAQ